MNVPANIHVGRDRTGRLHVARCLRCGELVAASTDLEAVERAAGRHACNRPGAFRAESERPKPERPRRARS